MHGGVVQFLHGGGAKYAPNNNIYIIKYIIIEYNKSALGWGERGI